MAVLNRIAETLRGVGAFVDDKLHVAVAFMHGARPAPHGNSTQAIQFHIAKPALRDVLADGGFAETLVWQGVELAGTPVGTITIGELSSTNFPWCHSIHSL